MMLRVTAVTTDIAGQRNSHHYKVAIFWFIALCDRDPVSIFFSTVLASVLFYHLPTELIKQQSFSQ